MTNYQDISLSGYRRANGRVGIRNHVLLISVDDISNAAVIGVESLVRGTLALPHPYGRLQFGADLDLTFNTLIGYGKNPNVAAAIVIGIEPNWTNHIVEQIAETGKPVHGFSIERTGDLQTIADAARVAQEFVQYATELPPRPRRVERDPGLDQVWGVRHHERLGLQSDGRPRLRPSRGRRQHLDLR